jgi:hydrogenase nickel incorporation protein HypA/HybF
MHEASIAQNIILTLEQRIEQGEIEGRVSKIFLQIGRLRGVLEENLKFLFGVLSRGSPLQGSLLEIETIPIRANCLKCKSIFEAGELGLLCTRCYSNEVEVVSGTELLISAVEVE